MMDGFDVTNGILPATQAADRCGKKHHFIHIIRLVVSPSLLCYTFKIEFTQLLGLNVMSRKTTKITKNKYSIRRLAHRSCIKIDTSLKTGRYWMKAHASCAILQEARTARLLAAGCKKCHQLFPQKGKDATIKQCLMVVKEGGHFLGTPHRKEMMTKPVVDATLDGWENNPGGTRTKNPTTMWFVAFLF